ncbi:ribosome recycling factor [Candidatus Adlerbacteria bacterium RIFCSPHIGHO2_01_FULL_54_23]|uniref:Ribosome recycling factor n=3 Tax=Candidatus Adleribacteriota TaxID=1752736 RepID=A0A1F4Y0P6_9BACT|nr:MAG: Ribosome recycling factor [Candidatus Adlerbacteria bacterium GW2011_GWA1_54_10]KKW37919.1 MAG: Ribosome recycling factor [Candidatus Adlerbacteria bacterium GW2011_GWB1_54_7]OGC78530.1 MAG: ribosome recycling factor [Candidatus Adlerbacteria bacterium RIFCSPHIGHO2_01_FULL_54_23]OGC87540.1 MAG: ribosome recycling factor [Candidatus Adlerbacteria bacterium RIFCSPLOWO2_01_FULL_54_16]
MAMYDFKQLEQKIKTTGERLQKDLSGVRTSHAAPAILDGVLVESYGTRVPIPQVASIVVEDARTLRITPWDSSLGKDIEKAVTLANLGLSVGMDERGVRISFPELTSERRAGLIKLARERLEEARTSLRSARDEVWSDIQKKEKDGVIPEDDKFRFKDEMEKRVKAANQQFDGMLERKEKEISA